MCRPCVNCQGRGEPSGLTNPSEQASGTWLFVPCLSPRHYHQRLWHASQFPLRQPAFKCSQAITTSDKMPLFCLVLICRDVAEASCLTNANEQLLWHGCPSLSNIQIITTTGFDMRLSNYHGKFGAGTYFAGTAAYSDHYSRGVAGNAGAGLTMQGFAPPPPGGGAQGSVGPLAGLTYQGAAGSTIGMMVRWCPFAQAFVMVPRSAAPLGIQAGPQLVQNQGNAAVSAAGAGGGTGTTPGAGASATTAATATASAQSPGVANQAGRLPASATPGSNGASNGLAAAAAAGIALLPPHVLAVAASASASTAGAAAAASSTGGAASQAPATTAGPIVSWGRMPPGLMQQLGAQASAAAPGGAAAIAPASGAPGVGSGGGAASQAAASRRLPVLWARRSPPSFFQQLMQAQAGSAAAAAPALGAPGAAAGAAAASAGSATGMPSQAASSTILQVVMARKSLTPPGPLQQQLQAQGRSASAGPAVTGAPSATAAAPAAATGAPASVTAIIGSSRAGQVVTHTWAGQHAMLLCRVALGRVGRGGSGMRLPPAGYDSVSHYGRQNCPGDIYAVYDNAQAYPEYIVHYDVRQQAEDGQ